MTTEQDWPVPETPVGTELLDSQAAGDYDVRVMSQIRERAADGYERASGGSEVKAGNLLLNDLHYVLSSHDGQYARGATTMRYRCVEKVKAMRDGWKQKHSQLNSDAELIERLVLEGDMRVADEIITALEAVTLEQQQENQ